MRRGAKDMSPNAYAIAEYKTCFSFVAIYFLIKIIAMLIKYNVNKPIFSNVFI